MRSRQYVNNTWSVVHTQVVVLVHNTMRLDSRFIQFYLSLINYVSIPIDNDMVIFPYSAWYMYTQLVVFLWK